MQSVRWVWLGFSSWKVAAKLKLSSGRFTAVCCSIYSLVVAAYSSVAWIISVFVGFLPMTLYQSFTPFSDFEGIIEDIIFFYLYSYPKS